MAGVDTGRIERAVHEILLAIVIVELRSCRAPRVVTQRCCASSTTSTPFGSSPASSVSAISSVSRS